MKKFLLLSTLSLAVATSLQASVIAKAGDVEITTDDIAPILATNLHGNKAMSKEENKTMIDNIIKYKLLVKEAKNSGVLDDPEYKKQIATVADSIAFGIWQKKEFDKISVSDDDAKKYYDEHSKEFLKPEEIQAKHILTKTEDDAKKIIEELNKVDAKNLKTEFEKIAKEKSIDPTAKQNGGEIGWFSKQMMVEPFANAAFALKDGEFSKTPVKSQFGYHIILKEASKKSEKIPFDKVKEMIKMKLKQEKFQKEIEDKANALFKNVKVEYTAK